MIKEFLLDLIFPRFCIGCQKEMDTKQASFICEVCFNKIALNGVECHVCGLKNDAGTCKRCREKTYLSGLFSAGKYEDPILREAIHQFKYRSMESLKKPLSKLLIDYLNKENLAGKLQCSASGLRGTPILVPIPLTLRRKLSRGFNQSELLAEELSSVLNCPVVNLLKRQKFTAPQAKIQNWKQRSENISGAFYLNRRFSKPIKSPKIMLIDDVATSGSTMEEAAKTLKQAGAKEIYGLVVAKG